MVVDHTDGLHEGVTNRWSHKSKATFHQSLAHRGRFLRLRGDAAECLPGIALRGATDELPEKRVERFSRLDHFEKRAGIADR
jgi:hypothetical protein